MTAFDFSFDEFHFRIGGGTGEKEPVEIFHLLFHRLPLDDIPVSDIVELAEKGTGVEKKEPLFYIDGVIAFRQQPGIPCRSAEKDEE